MPRQAPTGRHANPTLVGWTPATRWPPSNTPPWPFATTTTWATPEINTAIADLRDVLGDQTYESFARKGETMTTAEMATYAYDQIDQARAELNAVSK
jgi:hypothetical protein